MHRAAGPGKTNELWAREGPELWPITCTHDLGAACTLLDCWLVTNRNASNLKISILRYYSHHYSSDLAKLIPLLFISNLPSVLVGSSAHNKIPQTRLEGSNRNLHSHGSGGWKSKVKVSANLVSGKNSLPGLQKSNFLLCPQMAFSQCVHIERISVQCLFW